ncbi:glutathione S-transferase [Paracidovorax valerianellae]|uniref:Glutathione S-transferase n=1 Tax=Paracidovorax valerianellae TaxID=187868 RepID=A0A1G6MTU8_9BURK|nr:glutathione S-transferase [Paracidovorax valerianellae]MDA8443924.1 glutathione S-transferase [Paracidovorax valerianellae]SDC59028.1 Glutathione S-transferase [Paracidovorax valerianellae]
MQLVGMLDSPYVRRVAVSLRLLDLPFEHLPLSVFGTFEAFGRINPVVKAPTLVADDGSVLMNSSLILQWVATLSQRSLRPLGGPALQRDLRITGLALAACEKAVQLVYERNLRPAERQHAPWTERVSGQLRAACALLEAELGQAPLPAPAQEITDAGVTTAVAWGFMQMMVADTVHAADHPLLAAYAQQAERLPAFAACPAR